MPKKMKKKAAKKAVPPPQKKSMKKAPAKKAVRKTAKSVGRPKGTGKYGCETKAVRVPRHMVAEIEAFVRSRIKSGKK